MSKIILCGDSTVTEQKRENPHNPAVCYCGWGQMLHKFVKDNVKVFNFAISGLTTESFRCEGHWNKACAVISEGDYVLFQFGHNDQKRPHLRAELQYSENLKEFASETRKMGAIPIFVTPVARNTWKDDALIYNDLLEEYSNAVIKLGEKINVSVIDLHKASVNWIVSLGLHGAKKFFYPGDYTHPNDYGGFAWAKMISSLVSESLNETLLSFKKLFLTMQEWEDFNINIDDNDLVCGWTAEPNQRTTFAKWNNEKILTIASALEMAQEGYGYFVCNDCSDDNRYPALSAAQENGYLPKNFPIDEKKLEAQISADQFVELMINSCKGRNVISDLPEVNFVKDRDYILGKEAVLYATELEKLTTGSKSNNKSSIIKAPKGS